MSTALVTCAAGFVGSNLATTLLDRGYDVRGVDNFATGREETLDSIRERDAFSFHEADVRDGMAMADLTEGVDYVFHQAAVPSVPRSVEDPVTTTDANCTGTATVLDAARHADVEGVVVASSSSVYGTGGDLPKVETQPTAPESPYALSKYFTEKLALQFSDLYDIETVALRYFNIFGPTQDPEGAYAAVIPKFVERMRAGKRPVIYGDGEQSRDFTYIDNAVAANIAAATSDCTGEALNVGCADNTTINELVDVLNEELGTDLEPRYEDPRPGDVRHSFAAIEKASERIGYEPTVGFREGIERTVEGMQSARPVP